MGYALQLNMGQLLDVIKVLPLDDKYFLKTCIEKDLSNATFHQSLTDKLLHGPVMSDEQLQSYQQLKTDFAEWTKKL